MPKLVLPAFLAFSFSIPAVCQTTQFTCSASLGNVGGQMMAVTRTGVGTPYSLTATIKTSWKLSDGNTLSGFTTSRQVRDSQGRTRVDNPMGCVRDKDHQLTWQGSISVEDPVAQTRTRWMEGEGPRFKTATVMHDPSFREWNPPTAQEQLREAKVVSQSFEHAGPEADRYKVEDLGKRDVAGLEASGMRITRVQAAGTIGNLLPLAYVEEKWVSDQYGMIVKDIMDDPVLGSTTYEVTNFTPGEPDASLFQPPADYEVKTQ